MDGARSIRFERQDLCWPLLFHVEPLIASFNWKTSMTIVVIGADGRHEFADVASAQAATQQPPHRVEMYAVFQNGHTFKVGLWVVGFAPGLQPAATVDVEQGMTDEGRQLNDAVAEFLIEDGPEGRTRPVPEVREGRWRLIANQPWTVQVIGGVIATLLASAVVALITVLFR